MGDRGYARQVEELGHHRPDLMVVIVDRHLPEQDQVELVVLELRGERPRRFEAVGVEALGLQQDAAIGTHRERGADRLLGSRGPERDDDDFSRPRLFLLPQGFFDGEFVVGIEDEFDAHFVE